METHNENTTQFVSRVMSYISLVELIVVDFNNSKSNLWYVCSRMLMNVTIVTAETPYLYLDSLECIITQKHHGAFNDSTFPLGSLDTVLNSFV